MKELNDLEYLELLTEENIPKFFDGLGKTELSEMRAWIETMLIQQNTGLDKLFDGMLLSMKFIPNFVLIGMIKQFMDPSLAARIASRMEFKPLLNLAQGLSVEYLGETSIFISPDLATKIILALKPSIQKDTLIYIATKHPLRSLDLADMLTPSLQQILANEIEFSTLAEDSIHSPSRKHALTILKKLRSRS